MTGTEIRRELARRGVSVSGAAVSLWLSGHGIAGKHLGPLADVLRLTASQVIDLFSRQGVPLPLVLVDLVETAERRAAVLTEARFVAALGAVKDLQALVVEGVSLTEKQAAFTAAPVRELLEDLRAQLQPSAELTTPAAAASEPASLRRAG